MSVSTIALTKGSMTSLTAWNDSRAMATASLDEATKAYIATDGIAGEISRVQTLAMARIVRVLDEQAAEAARDKGSKVKPASTATIQEHLREATGRADLTVKSNQPPAWRNAARLYFDLDIQTGDRLAAYAVDNTVRGLTDALTREGQTADGFREWMATEHGARMSDALWAVMFPDRERVALTTGKGEDTSTPTDSGAPDTRANTSTSGTSTTGEGELRSTKVAVGDLTVAQRVTLLEQILTSLKPGDLSAEAKATLTAHAERLA